MDAMKRMIFNFLVGRVTEKVTAIKSYSRVELMYSLSLIWVVGCNSASS